MDKSENVTVDSGAPLTSGAVLIGESRDSELSYSPLTRVVKSRVVDVSYFPMALLHRLEEDINELPEIKGSNHDWFSWALGVAPTAFIGMLCDFDSTKLSFIVYLGAFIISVSLAIYFGQHRKQKEEAVKINEKICAIKKDLRYVLNRCDEEKAQSDESFISGRE